MTTEEVDALQPKVKDYIHSLQAQNKYLVQQLTHFIKREQKNQIRSRKFYYNHIEERKAYNRKYRKEHKQYYIDKQRARRAAAKQP